MSVVVIYRGNAPAVEGRGFLFPNGEPVEVPEDLAESLGSAFDITSTAESLGSAVDIISTEDEGK